MLWQGRENDGHTVPGASEPGDEFGASLAVGDFDGDGRDDLAIGAPLDDISGVDSAGHVVILYGQPVLGLTAEGALGLTRGTTGMVGPLGAFDTFGAALVTGDFNQDGFSDLVVGSPNDSPGAFDVIYGSPSGLGPRASTPRPTSCGTRPSMGSMVMCSPGTTSGTPWPVATSMATVSTTSRSACPIARARTS